ncbi:Rha family regulatory protein [Vibrio phage 1.214.O._10N.222.54.F11]|nr:Rha family regulatory protein [Vibrio phage 1.214.O._10N.222.54.F11]
MNDLVIMKNEVPVISTFDLFPIVGYTEHRNLKQTIDDHMESFNEFGVIRFENVKPKGSKGGRPVKAYLLNEEQFTFLAMLMRNTPEVVKLKVKVAKEFIRMRQTISNLISQRDNPDWQNVRSDGKAVYLQKTDVIKEFVDYAKAQGSTSAERYYSNLATMENKALFFIERKYKNMREIMTIKQLMQIATADDVVEKAIKEGMSEGLHYKEIFKLAKSRVISFANIIGKSHVHDLSLSKPD